MHLTLTGITLKVQVRRNLGNKLLTKKMFAHSQNIVTFAFVNDNNQELITFKKQRQ